MPPRGPAGARTEVRNSVKASSYSCNAAVHHRAPKPMPCASATAVQTSPACAYCRIAGTAIGFRAAPTGTPGHACTPAFPCPTRGDSCTPGLIASLGHPHDPGRTAPRRASQASPIVSIMATTAKTCELISVWEAADPESGHCQLQANQNKCRTNLALGQQSKGFQCRTRPMP
jgi:hypothetical protein